MKNIILLCITIVILLSVSSMTVIGDTPKLSDLKLYNGSQMEINTAALKNVGETLQSIADGYTPYSRLGWTVVVNGEQLSDKSNWIYGYGQITGYDKTQGTLTGPGYAFRASIGQGENPKVESLGPVTISVDVKTNQATFTSTKNADNLGMFLLEKGAGQGVFFGSGDSPLFTSPMCILEFSNAQTNQNTSGNDVIDWKIQTDSVESTKSDNITKNTTAGRIKSATMGSI